MTRQTFMREVSRHGASIDAVSEELGTLDIDLPTGKVWRSNLSHTICEPFKNNGGQSWKADAYKYAVERMDMGTMPCDDPECDVCNDF